MFEGQYFHNTDAKGRIVMPSQLREGLGESFIITRGYEGCLTVYSNEEWERFAARLAAMPEHNAAARRILRIFSSGAARCEADKQGRILIPAHLREYAGIQKEVVIIGTLSKIELWDADKWGKYNNDDDSITLEEAAESLSSFGG